MRRLTVSVVAAVAVGITTVPQAAVASAPARATSPVTAAQQGTAAKQVTAQRYNGAAAAAYAARYARNGDDLTHRAYNPRYKKWVNGDCANFASQALAAGGLRRSATWYPYTPAWRGAANLYRELRKRGYRVTVFQGKDLAKKYTGAKPGDVYFYDWGTNKGIGHAAIAMSDGKQVRVENDGKTYVDGYGSRISQHTTDRVNAAWNVGYLKKDWYINTARMKVYLVHVR